MALNGLDVTLNLYSMFRNVVTEHAKDMQSTSLHLVRICCLGLSHRSPGLFEFVFLTVLPVDPNQNSSTMTMSWSRNVEKKEKKKDKR